MDTVVVLSDSLFRGGAAGNISYSQPPAAPLTRNFSWLLGTASPKVTPPSGLAHSCDWLMQRYNPGQSEHLCSPSLGERAETSVATALLFHVSLAQSCLRHFLPGLAPAETLQ